MPESDWTDGALIEGVENWLSIVGDLMLDHPKGWNDDEAGFGTPAWTDSKLLHSTRSELVEEISKLGREAILESFYCLDPESGNILLDEDKTIGYFFA